MKALLSVIKYWLWPADLMEAKFVGGPMCGTVSLLFKMPREGECIYFDFDHATYVYEFQGRRRWWFLPGNRGGFVAGRLS